MRGARGPTWQKWGAVTIFSVGVVYWYCFVTVWTARCLGMRRKTRCHKISFNSSFATETVKKKNILVKLTPLKRSWVLCRERNLLPKAWLLQRWRPLGRDCGKTPQNTALGPQRGQHPLPPVHQREPQLLSGTSARRFQSPVPSAVCDKDTEL